MINIKCQEHYDSVLLYAKSINKEINLKECLTRLENFGEVELYKDFAPYSFSFMCFKNGIMQMNGGLIYHDAEADKVNFSVSLNPTIGWSIHT